jgi:hypothetical protein
VPQERRGGREKVLLETPVPVWSYGPKRLDHHERGALRAPERLQWPGGSHLNYHLGQVKPLYLSHMSHISRHCMPQNSVSDGHASNPTRAVGRMRVPLDRGAQNMVAGVKAPEERVTAQN